PRKARRMPAGEPGKPRRARRASPATAGRASAAAAGRASAAAAGGAARLGPPQVEEWPDGSWVVRQVPGAAATKLYRCPGCDQEVAIGTAHVVVWPAESPGPQARRHWHTMCWQRRRPRPQPTWW
ncbi:MAG: hypothetical protein J2P27_04415, partial [Actinobacteria bacterium]|nr:hypothetical protein [Actinomycetota bacterium]